jgi:hypothetical protein
MPYNTNSLKELKRLLRERGLSDGGRRKKAELIQILLENDRKTSPSDHNDVVSSGADDDDDDEVTFGAASRPTISKKGDETNSQIEILKLQLQIEQAKVRQSELGIIPSGESNSRRSSSTARLDIGNIKSRLPVMASDDDILSFFQIFERALQICDVPREMWSTMLPACLNQRAAKIFNMHPIDVCRDYDAIRNILCEAFKGTPDYYYRQFKGAHRSGTDSYRLHLCKLREHYAAYLSCSKLDTFAELCEDNIKRALMAAYRRRWQTFAKVVCRLRLMKFVL